MICKWIFWGLLFSFVEIWTRKCNNLNRNFWLFDLKIRFLIRMQQVGSREKTAETWKCNEQVTKVMFTKNEKYSRGQMLERKRKCTTSYLLYKRTTWCIKCSVTEHAFRTKAFTLDGQFGIFAWDNIFGHHLGLCFWPETFHRTCLRTQAASILPSKFPRKKELLEMSGE